MNKYSIFWIALVPLKGKSTKSDSQIVGKILERPYSVTNSGKSIFTFLPSTELATKAINSLKGKLSKQYKAYKFTDAQFGLQTLENKDITLLDDGRGVKLTELQKKESIIV